MTRLGEEPRGNDQIALGAAANGIEAARYERDAHRSEVAASGRLSGGRASCPTEQLMIFLQGEVEER